MSGVKSTMPLWKWILLIVFGSALFLFLSQTVPVVGSFSNNIWLKALLLLLGATAVLGLYAVWVYWLLLSFVAFGAMCRTNANIS